MSLLTTSAFQLVKLKSGDEPSAVWHTLLVFFVQPALYLVVGWRKKLFPFLFLRSKGCTFDGKNLLCPDELQSGQSWVSDLG